jgi:hypothetical protein
MGCVVTTLCPSERENAEGASHRHTSQSMHDVSTYRLPSAFPGCLQHEPQKNHDLIRRPI